MSSKSVGNHGENVAAGVLRRMGVELVEKIGTPVIVKRRGRDLVVVAYEEKVSGDHRGILPGGRSVLAETKTIRDHNLCWSDFSDHQPERLTAHADFGGLSLVVWIRDTVFVMEWPIPNFGPGKSITPALARQLDLSMVRL